MTQKTAGEIQFCATRDTADALYEWRMKHGKEKCIAACCGMITASIGMLVHLCGERSTYDYLQRKADKLIEPELPR